MSNNSRSACGGVRGRLKANGLVLSGWALASLSMADSKASPIGMGPGRTMVLPDCRSGNWEGRSAPDAELHGLGRKAQVCHAGQR